MHQIGRALGGIEYGTEIAPYGELILRHLRWDGLKQTPINAWSVSLTCASGLVDGG